MSSQLRVEIPLLLPDVPDAADRCVDRLLADLRNRDGVTSAHLVQAPEAGPAQLCIHFDPEVLPLARIRQLAEAAGARISERFGHATWSIDVQHARRARTLTDVLRSVPGVIDASVSADGATRVEFDRALTSVDAIKAELLDHRAGAPAPTSAQGQGGREAAAGGHRHDESGHSHDASAGFWSSTELRASLACGALLLAGFLVERFLAAPGWVPMGAYLAAYGFGGWFTLREAIENLQLKRFEIDTLMIVAAAGAAALGAWAEGALLLFLFSLGHALEHYAMGRAKQAIEALAEIAPRVAVVRRGAELVEVPVETLAVGDTVVVKPNSRLAADGFVVSGESSIDQAPVTGESMPVDKSAVADPSSARVNPDAIEAKHRVFAGTINGSGAIEIEVTRKSTDTVLSKVVRMVSEAETEQSPTQRFTEGFERIFVPAVLALGKV